MVNIPPEIWFHVAKFIPSKDLPDLLEVNSIFFSIAMDIRYREVLITTKAVNQTMKTLERLSDPFIASRVCRLSLELTPVKARGLSTSPTASSSHSASHQCIRHPSRLLNRTIARFFGGPKSSRLQPEHVVIGTVTFTDLINEIINTTDKLVNIRELCIESCNLPLDYDPRPLFTSFWSSFGRNLYTLSFCGNLEGCRTFINSNPTFDGLRELHVEFTNNIFRVDPLTDMVILVDVFLPFINSLAPRLLLLGLWSWAFVDLSVFFSRLAPFPYLKALNIRTPFNLAFGDGSSGLKRFICDSSATLLRVELRLNPTGLPADPLAEEPLSQWLSRCISDERFFSHLQILDIYPTNLDAGMDFLLGCIRRTSNSLVQLIVRDRCLRNSEIKVILDAASSCSNLTYFRMNIWRLDVDLTDLLALKLPSIERLWLSIGENAANNPNYLIDTFVQDLGTRLYSSWKLEDISIWQNGQAANSDIMLAIAQSIPTLTSFFSNGHMQLYV